MPEHKHSSLMLLYAQDAMETDKPWERWEFKDEDNNWSCFSDDLFEHRPGWYEDVEYRRKPQTININGFNVPEPVWYK